jgi:hypothetical protein
MMSKRRPKCRECGGRNVETCEVCWARAMIEHDERVEDALTRENDRRIDEARGK